MPIGLPSAPVPAKDGCRRDEQKRLAPAREPARHQNPEQAITIGQKWPRLFTLQDQKLLAKAHILSNQRRPRTQEPRQSQDYPSHRTASPNGSLEGNSNEISQTHTCVDSIVTPSRIFANHIAFGPLHQSYNADFIGCFVQVPYLVVQGIPLVYQGNNRELILSKTRVNMSSK